MNETFQEADAIANKWERDEKHQERDRSTTRYEVFNPINGRGDYKSHLLQKSRQMVNTSFRSYL
jgi:hypothetical protein